MNTENKEEKIQKVQLSFNQKVKKNIWRQIYRFFPFMQEHLLRWHIVWHEKKRQPYHIGWLKEGKTLQDLEDHLHKDWGFGNHFVAWKDTGQVLSWRKLVSFDNQYHLRVFEDGEIRGHYEYTPESKPFDHFVETSEESRIEDFKNFLGDMIQTKKYISHLVPDVHNNPESEITIDDIDKKD